jgi:predicted nucleotidyltransferase
MKKQEMNKNPYDPYYKCNSDHLSKYNTYEDGVWFDKSGLKILYYLNDAFYNVNFHSYVNVTTWDVYLKYYEENTKNFLLKSLYILRRHPLFINIQGTHEIDLETLLYQTVNPDILIYLKNKRTELYKRICGDVFVDAKEIKKINLCNDSVTIIHTNQIPSFFKI